MNRAIAPVAVVLGLVGIYLSGNDYLINLGVVCAIYTIPAIGLGLLFGRCRQISLGHAAFVAIGAYVAAITSNEYGIDPWFSVLLATLTGGLCAWAVGKLMFRLSGHHLAMATLALGMIVHTVLVEWRSVTGGPDGTALINPLVLGSVDLMSDRAFFLLGWGVACLLLLASDNLIRSPFGLGLRVVGESESVASSIGIKPNALKVAAMTISGGLAGLSGALYAYWLGYISPDPFNVAFSLKLLLIVALGGYSGSWRLLVGVFFVVVISEVLKAFGRWDTIIFGLLLIAAMLYPQGWLGGMFDQFRQSRQATAGDKRGELN
ncbi:Branched-chain amino acid transport system permease protein LivM [Marinobacterium lacunae]|uniref:Branched-chain amino acid transport system permease protein LivM n=1 Tax=Marinobacterium lacunae TaxID=1232683 RepID=A0A081G0Z7_9GAMM|nr:branched-chain amino acid ABC transporter permease [Marinobacterium lacunae]KEA64452.1 Branched-chain amino acid transport system permease protein LivM [Marinobacterium lacunae]